MKIFTVLSIRLLLGWCILGACVPAAFSATLYSTDFESGSETVWSATNLNAEVVNPFTVFSGRFGNDAQTLSMSNLVIGANYSLFFDLYIIDSWDGGSDRFKVDVAGVNCFDHSFYYYNPPANQSYPLAPDVGPSPLGFGEWNDSIYRNIEIAFQAVSNQQELVFYGEGLDSLDNESWGIDNVVVQDYEPTSFVETSLPTGSSATALAWFSITAGRDITESTATNAANFELRAAGGDGLFETADDTLYSSKL
jgi:hypothetical protein